jgi:hypothetical protein
VYCSASAPWFGDNELNPVRHCAVAILDRTRATLPFWSPFEPPMWPFFRSIDAPSDFQWDPVDWASRHLVLSALLHYLEELSRVDQAGDDAARACADDVLNVAAASSLHYVTIVPLSGAHLNSAGAQTLAKDTLRFGRSLTSSRVRILRRAVACRPRHLVALSLRRWPLKFMLRDRVTCSSCRTGRGRSPS